MLTPTFAPLFSSLPLSRRPLSRLNMSKHICSYTTGCRFFSSDLNPEEATNIEAPALSNVSYNYVMSNLHLDPVYCADYVAEAFTYALFHAANPVRFWDFFAITSRPQY